MKVAICDDNKIDQDYVISLLRTWAQLTDRKLELYTFTSAEQFLFQYAEEKDYKILILDIEMGKMNGVALAKELRKENQELQIIFVTGFPDFIAEGYEVDAIHYLMKPLEQGKFLKAMEKAVTHLKHVEPVILLQESGEAMRIATKNILYVEVFSHSCVLHTTEEHVEYKISISKLEKELGEQFVRVHRSYLVNIEWIKRIAKTEVILENGDTVPLSRRKYNEVNLAFIDYFKRRLETQ